MKKLLKTGGLTLVILAFLVSTLFFAAVANDAAAESAKVYLSDYLDIQRSDLDGSNLENVNDTQVVFPISLLVVFQSRALQLDTADGKMYWLDAGSVRIRRSKMDGSNNQELLNAGDGLEVLEGMALDLTNRKIYWTNGSKLLRANMDPQGNGGAGTRTDIELLYETADGPFGVVSNTLRGIALDVAGGKMYWVEVQGGPGTPPGKIRRANLELQGFGTPSARTDIEDVIIFDQSAVQAPHQIALDLTPGAETIYFGVITSSIPAPIGRIERADLTLGFPLTRDPLTVFEAGAPREIVLDLNAGEMYWSEPDVGRFRKANLDGSNVQQLVTGFDTPRGIALDLTGQAEFETTLAGTPDLTAIDQAGAGAVTEMTSDGSLVVVTAPNGISNPTAPVEEQVFGGVAVLYERDLISGDLVEVATLNAGTDIQLGAEFGAAADISPDGTLVMIGAPLEDCEVAGSIIPDAGAVYLWELQNGMWQPLYRLESPDPATAPAPGELGDGFGEFVSITNEIAHNIFWY